MIDVRVRASSTYDCLIGGGLMPRAGELLREVFKPCTAAIVTDTTVNQLYGDAVEQSLKDAGWLLAAMALHGRSVALTDPALNAAQRLAVVLGREGTGLSEDTLRRCDCSVRIPMMAGIDSLNVAAAAAVAFWQLGPCARGDDGASEDDAEGWDR